MSCKIKSISVFERQAKRLIKKFPSLKSEIKELVKELREKPNQGSPLGRDCFKIRLAIKSKRKGKSGGARIVTNFVMENNTIHMLSIYDKSEKDNLSDGELTELLKFI